MIVTISTTKDAAGKWWGTVDSEDTTLYFEEGFRTRKEAKATMVRYMCELRVALFHAINAATAKEKT